MNADKHPRSDLSLQEHAAGLSSTRGTQEQESLIADDASRDLNFGASSGMPPEVFQATSPSASSATSSASSPEQAQDLESLSGVLERIVFFNEDNHYCVGELRPDEGERLVTILGKLPGVQCGETLVLSGRWVNHSVHGRQFQLHAFESKLPSSVFGIRKYLGSGLVQGIGKGYAKKIVDYFGEHTLEIISSDSGRLYEVPGIGKERAKSIKEAWDEQQSIRDVLMFLQTYGVTTAQCIKLVKAYGNQAKEVIETQPYTIARQIQGFGFKTVDKIALNIGFSNNSPPRLDAGIIFALETLEDEGHTCMEEEALRLHAAQLLQVEDHLLTERIQALMESGQLIQPEGTTRLQLPTLMRAEAQIAYHVERIYTSKSELVPIIVDKAIAWAQERSGFEFAAEQIQAIEGALTHKFSILTGGPGTGKTTILRALVDILRAKKARILLASPTGRAAQRMSETTRHFAQTIHRLLKIDPETGRFVMNEESPLSCDFLIIDEASMLDTRLASALVRAMPSAAHLLLVGDVDQLPSVGPGNILKDLIESGMAKVTRLGQVFRQSKRSEIVLTAHRIREGSPASPKPEEMLTKLDPSKDMQLLSTLNPDLCLDGILGLCQHWIRQNLQMDPIDQVQILAPMHRGIVGTGNINRVLQKALNPQKEGIQVSDTRFQMGDKVIQTRNNYEKGVFNGELGRIIALNKLSGSLQVRFDSGVVDFERSELISLQLAYAISIHKSQGSEFPIVIIPLLKQHFVMLQRNLLYTAITRGRKKVFVVGDSQAWAMAVSNQDSSERLTDLKRKLGVLNA